MKIDGVNLNMNRLIPYPKLPNDVSAGADEAPLRHEACEILLDALWANDEVELQLEDEVFYI